MDWVLHHDEPAYPDWDDTPIVKVKDHSGFGCTGELDDSHKPDSLHPTNQALNSFQKALLYGTDPKKKKIMEAVMNDSSPAERADIESAPFPMPNEEFLLCGLVDFTKKLKTTNVLGNGGFGYVVDSLVVGGNDEEDPTIRVAAKFESFGPTQFKAFKRAILKQCAVKTEGVARVFAYYPVKVLTKEDDQEIKTPKLLMCLLMELGDCTLDDEILKTYDALDETYEEHQAGNLTSLQLKRQLLGFLVTLLGHWGSLADIVLELNSKGVLHRDIKCVNIIFDVTVPKLIDFGLARAMPGPGGQTLTYQRGTEGYWPPGNEKKASFMMSIQLELLALISFGGGL
jgi:hypothetical protein